VRNVRIPNSEYVQCDTFRCTAAASAHVVLTCLIHTLNTAHVCVCHDSFICAKWRIHTCDKRYLYVWQDALICVTWLTWIHRRCMSACSLRLRTTRLCILACMFVCAWREWESDSTKECVCVWLHALKCVWVSDCALHPCVHWRLWLCVREGEHERVREWERETERVRVSACV